MNAVDRKLAVHAEYADKAIAYLVGWLLSDRDALIDLARGRLVEGHYRYEDRLMYEYTVPTLKAEASQELADAINYIARRLELTAIDGACQMKSSASS